MQQHLCKAQPSLPAAELDRIAAALTPTPGYPARHERLFLGAPGLHIIRTGLHVPPGPWHVTDHPNRAPAPAGQVDAEIPGPGGFWVDPQRTARWRAAGLVTDQHGRPVHPDWRALLADPRIGLPTGLGYFWRWGPNTTVDAYLQRTGPHGPEILLIQRRCGQWALPGGFVDPADASAQDAALRELAEETGLHLPAARARTVLTRRSTGPMATLHAWTENTVIRIDADPHYLAHTAPHAGDDAVDAAWIPRATALAMPLYDTHSQYIAQLTNPWAP